MQLSSTAQAAGKASVRSCAPRLTRTTNAPGRRASQQARPIFGGAPLKSVFSSGRTQQVATIAEQVTTDAVVAPAAPAAEPYLGKKAVIVGAGALFFVCTGESLRLACTITSIADPYWLGR